MAFNTTPMIIQSENPFRIRIFMGWYTSKYFMCSYWVMTLPRSAFVWDRPPNDFALSVHNLHDSEGHRLIADYRVNIGLRKRLGQCRYNGSVWNDIVIWQRWVVCGCGVNLNFYERFLWTQLFTSIKKMAALRTPTQIINTHLMSPSNFWNNHSPSIYSYWDFDANVIAYCADLPNT